MFKYKTGSLLLASTFTLLSACGGSSGGGASTDSAQNNDSGNLTLAAQQEALSQIAGVVVTTIENSQTTASTLSTSIATYCEELEGDTTNVGSAKVSAQDAWRAAMNAWQAAEVMNFGPSLVDPNNTVRDRVYSWPAVSACFVDGAVIDYNDDMDAFNLAIQSPRRVGFDALEYLLFTDTLSHACPTDSSSTQTAEGIQWNTLAEADRSNARCAYAELIAQDINSQISGLLEEWQGEGDNFSAQLSNAGGSSTVYTSATEALNDVSDAMFYLESEVKDLKLAETTGISADCSGTSCPDRIESLYADNSLANLTANLEGFSALLSAGIDDLLAAVGQEGIANSMKVDLSAAISNLDSFEGSFIDSVNAIDENDCTNTTSENRVEPACALHADIKKVTDVLKSDFVTALTLAIPQSSVGDND